MAIMFIRDKLYRGYTYIYAGTSRDIASVFGDRFRMEDTVLNRWSKFPFDLDHYSNIINFKGSQSGMQIITSSSLTKRPRLVEKFQNCTV